MSSLKKILNNLIRPTRGVHQADKNLLITVGIIIVFGIIILFNATSVVGYSVHHDSYYFFKHQLFGLVLGLVAFLFFSNIDYHRWKKYAVWMLVFSVALLILVFIPGLSAGWGKARSWINIFGYSLQPSEFVKLTFLLYLAAWLETRKEKLKEFSQGIGPFMVILGFIALLMLMQPDIGTLTIIGLTSLTVYFIGGGKVSHIVIIIMLAILGLTVLAHYKPYQLDRFRCFIDPAFSKNEACYQVNQSLIAVGSGGIFGRGLGASRQKFLYLPEVSGDSIFPIIGEETGLLFSTGLIILYFILFYRGFLIARKAPDDFGKILAIGIVSWIVFQALINIGGMINLMPLTGLPLPFISYGGSAILAALSAVGILVNISKQTKQ